MFIFQERGDRHAERVFSSIARMTGGAHVPYDSNAPEELRRLLGAVARYAAGGRPALERYAEQLGTEETRALLSQLKPK